MELFSSQNAIITAMESYLTTYSQDSKPLVIHADYDGFGVKTAIRSYLARIGNVSVCAV